MGGFTAVQAVRAVHHYVFFEMHKDEPIQPWMTIQFVAHSYHVSPGLLQTSLGLPILPPDERPVARIAEAQGVGFDEPDELVRGRVVGIRHVLLHCRLGDAVRNDRATGQRER